jgi:hypothetical protein
MSAIKGHSAGSENLRWSLFSGAAPDSKRLNEARRETRMSSAGRNVGREFSSFLLTTQAPIGFFLIFFSILDFSRVFRAFGAD